MKRLIGALAVAGVGVVAYLAYKQLDNDDMPNDPEDTFNAGSYEDNMTLPALPIHPKWNPSATQGVFTPGKVKSVVGTSNVSSHYGDIMVPARNSDYLNWAQLVPTTGPGNLAPIMGSSREADFTGVVIPRPDNVTSGGPYSGNAGTVGFYNEDPSEVRVF